MLMIDCKKVKLGISGSRIENLAEFAYLTTELIKKIRRRSRTSSYTSSDRSKS